MNNSAKAMAALAVIAITIASMIALAPGSDAELQGEGKSSLDNLEPGTYYLTDSITLTSTFTVDQGDEYTINLNGFTISANLSTPLFTNNGTLSIIDSSGESGKISNTDGTPNVGVIDNAEGGTLSVGTIEISANNNVGIYNSGTCTVNGASIEITNENYSGGYASGCCAIRNEGEMTILDGTFETQSHSPLFTSDLNASTTINGGTFTSKNDYSVFAGSAVDPTITVNAGTFNGDPSAVVAPTSTVSESGGIYTVSIIDGESISENVASEAELIYFIGMASDYPSMSLTVSGDMVLSDDLTVPVNTLITIAEGTTLTVPADMILYLDGGLVVNGMLDIQGFVTNPLSITVSGGTVEGVETVEGGDYAVEDAMDLQWLTYLLNVYPDSEWNVSVVNTITIPEGVDFQMIGKTVEGDSYVNFTGTFDGNGNKISGLRMTSMGEDAALFSGTHNAVIKDLDIEVDIDTLTGYVAAIAASAYYGSTFSGITVSGSIQASAASYGVAGIAAYVGDSVSTSETSGSVLFIGCSNQAEVGGDLSYNVGSMFGTASNTTSDIGVYNCSNSGPITAMGSVGYVFGFGYLNSQGSFTLIAFSNTYQPDGGSTLVYCSSAGATNLYTEDENAPYALVGSDGEWTAGSEDDVIAELNGAGYVALSNALDDAVDGDTITIVRDCQITTTVFGKDITLDLGGNTVTLTDNGSSANGFIIESEMTIRNGTINDRRAYGVSDEDGNYALRVTGTSGDLRLEDLTVYQYDPIITDLENGSYNYAVVALNGATLTIGQGTKLIAQSNQGDYETYGVVGVGVIGDGVNTTSLTVEEGAYIDMTAFAIAGNGTADGTEFTINGGQIYSDTFVIYHPQGGKLNIEGGTLEGPNGVYFSGYGEVNISDGQITATADRAEAPFKDPSEGDGPAQDGAALSIVSRSGGYQSQGDTIEVNITGGTLISENNSAIAEYRLQKINDQWVVNYDGDSPDDPNVIPNFVSSVSVSGSDTHIRSAEGLDCFYADNPDAVSVTGGSFSSDVSDYLDENASGSYEDGEFVVTSPITVKIKFGSSTTTQELPAGSTVDDLTAPATDPADDGYLYAWTDGYDNILDPATVLQDGDTYEYRLFLETPTVSVSTSGPLYPGSSITVTVNVSHDASNVSLIYYYIVGDPSDPDVEIEEISEYNTFTISSPGTYTFLAMAFDESGVNSNPGYSVIDIEQSSIPVYPDDDDDYVPPIYVPGDTSSSDGDTVKIVACAAAAVVAAIMAAFLILGHRRD